MTTITLIYLSIILLLFMIYILRRFVFQTNKKPSELFAEALRNENCGYFEMALIKYESALAEVKSNRFIGNSLKSKIISKLKILHMVIEYKKGFHLGR